MEREGDAALERAIKAALDGYGLLFLGSGFPRGATNVAGTHLKTGGQLATALADALGLPPGDPLADLAAYFSSQQGESALVELLQREFQVQSIAPEHQTIAAMPWKRIYTTNFDEVFELGSRAAGHAIKTVLPSDPLSVLRDHARVCVHLNGAISKLNSEDVAGGQFQLTDASYAAGSFSTTPWARQLLLDVKTAQAVIFLGYSLYDIDVQKILLQSETDRLKIFFVCGKSLTPIATHKLERYGVVADADVVGFAARVELIRKDYTPRKVLDTGVECLDELHPASIVSSQTAGDIQKLLLFGQLSWDFLWQQREGRTQPLYACRRAVTDEILRGVSSGADIVIRSELGNGKTVLLEQVAVETLAAGLTTYRLKAAESDFELGQLGEVAQRLRKAVIIVDAYGSKRKEIEAIAAVRDKSVRFVVTARTVDHDVNAFRLETALGAPPLEFCIDRLSNAELEWFCTVLDENGFWRDAAAKSRSDKLRHLSDDRRYDGQVSNILLELIRSPAMSDRVGVVFAELQGSGEVLDAVVAVLILSVIEQEASNSLVGQLIGVEVVNQARFRSSAAVKALLESKAGVFAARSSVLATHLLKHKVNALRTVRILAKMVRSADEYSSTSNTMHNLSRELMRSARVQSVLPDNNAKAVILYYEDIRSVRSAQGNPLFWLQYAISLMAVSEYTDAEAKLQTAYALAANSQRFDTFMLDITQARWLLEDSCRNADVRSDMAMAMDRFRRARDLLVKRLTQRERHYPYRVATSYRAFYEIFAPVMSVEQKREIVGAAEHVLKCSERLPRELQNNRYVRECREGLRAILDDAAFRPSVHGSVKA